MKQKMSKIFRVVVTLVVVAIAALIGWGMYKKHFSQPWTRDGQVRAQVVQVAPRVSAPVVELAVVDNQFVKTGDLLFKLDTRTFKADLEQAQAQLDLAKDSYDSLDQQVKAAGASVTASEASIKQAQSSIKETTAEIAKNTAELDRQKNLLPLNATSQRSVDSAQASYDVSIEKRKTAQASLTQTEASLLQAKASLAASISDRGAVGEANASLRKARAALRDAELNLEFTEVRASVDGYVTNLTLRIGTQAVANQPMLALVDSNSFWVYGFFKETQVAYIKEGDKATVILMAYPKQALKGTVKSIGWGIAQSDGSTGEELLPSINPSFDWIRLAQRIPVRIHLDEVPDNIKLRVGTTTSVIIQTDMK